MQVSYLTPFTPQKSVVPIVPAIFRDTLWWTKELKQNISELKEEIKKQPKLEKQIKLLEKNAEKNELELIKQKQRIFDVVKSVPQTITINSDEEQKDDQI